MIQSEWNKTFRAALSEFLELPLERVLKQGQSEGLATYESFSTYFLESVKQSFDIFQGADKISVWYNLSYIVSLYDKSSSMKAQNFLLKLHTQRAKDILNPIGLRYLDSTILNNFIEYINDIGYQRTDIRVSLSAEYTQEPFEGHIRQIQFGYSTNAKGQSWHKV